MNDERRETIGQRAAGLLAILGDPDADLNRPHTVIVTDPDVNPRFHKTYGPYPTAAAAAAAVDVIRSKIDMGGPNDIAWTYTVQPLQPTP